MFGYVIADAGRLDEAQRARYRSCYCGLCRALRREYGFASRLALTYDMTFLALLLGSLYEPDEQPGCERCFAHPCRAHTYFVTPITHYAAAMNTALAYDNCMDDWHDDRSALRLAEAKLLRAAKQKAEQQYPRQCGAISGCLTRMAALESARGTFPDEAANEFGNLMAELFVYQNDRWETVLRSFGFALGKFIYFLDAACDSETDRKKGRYNPLLGLTDTSPGHLEQQLTLLIGDAAAQFERLPLVQDADLLQNILYSGVWTRFQSQFHKPKKEADS